MRCPSDCAGRSAVKTGVESKGPVRACRNRVVESGGLARRPAPYRPQTKEDDQLRLRTLAVRAFDANGMMVGWELVEGRDPEAAIERLNGDPRAAYLHVHYAAPGCYAAREERN